MEIANNNKATRSKSKKKKSSINNEPKISEITKKLISIYSPKGAHLTGSLGGGASEPGQVAKA